MKKRTAIIYGGSPYSTNFSLESQIKNLIDPNEADVFMVVTRGMKRRKTPASEIPLAEQNEKWNEKNATTIVDKTPLSDEEIQVIKETLGDRLKGFLVFEDTNDYYDHVVSDRKEMTNIANNYINECNSQGLPAPFRGKLIASDDNGTVRCVVDQYHHIKKAYELMEAYEKANDVQYEYVMRARIDFIVPFEFNILHYTLNHDSELLYICGTLEEERIWADEHTFFCKRPMSKKIFPQLDRMGMIVNRKYNTIEGDNDMVFDPEVQFGILLKELNAPIVNVKIFRSAKYTNDGQWDYFNYMFRRDTIDLNYEYFLVCSLPTDINFHLPKLVEIGKQCNNIVELGTRYGNSTIAFMYAIKDRPEAKFTAYDTQWNEKIDYLKLVGKESGVNFEMRIENPTPEEGESKLEHGIDLLFIDTNHHARQCELELRLHSHLVSRYLVFHDTTSFWSGLTGGQGGEAGLQYAIEPFLEANKGIWEMAYRSFENNGLMILKRINN